MWYVYCACCVRVLRGGCMYVVCVMCGGCGGEGVACYVVCVVYGAGEGLADGDEKSCVYRF